jgi:hypothetical protein
MGDDAKTTYEHIG